MSIGLIGKKIRMTRDFFDSGISVPVTVLSIEKGRILDIYTKEKRFTVKSGASTQVKF